MPTIARFAQLIALVLAGEAIFALPFVLPRVFRPVLMTALDINNTQLGYAFSVYGIVALLSYGFGGPLADRFAVRRMMAVALWTTALGGLWLALLPSYTAFVTLYGLWGSSTILLFWAGLQRATREWGGRDSQGRAFGLLDGGRGLFAAVVSTLATALFAWIPVSADQQFLPLQAVIVIYSLLTALAGVVIWTVLPDPKTRVPGIQWQHIAGTLKNPSVWLQAVIVVCAYVTYKGTDDLSLLAKDVLSYSNVDAAIVGTLAFWIRPIAALTAGLVADRVGGWKTIAACFALLVGANLAIVNAATGFTLLLPGIIASCIGVYGLRGVYFALFGEAGVPLAATGTAVGLVSLVGYTPDIFFGPVMGSVLDATPGPLGHAHLFTGLAVVACAGLVAALLFGVVSTRSTQPPQ